MNRIEQNGIILFTIVRTFFENLIAISCSCFLTIFFSFFLHLLPFTSANSYDDLEHEFALNRIYNTLEFKEDRRLHSPVQQAKLN